MSEMDFEHFPFLNHEEFSEACHHFESQYCRAELGPLRKRWKLRLCAALDTTFSTHGPYATYLQISRPLERILDHPDLSLGLGKLTFSEKDGRDAIIKADDGMMDAEEADSAVVIHHLRDREAEHVTYEIHLHPTYRVPCLWFTLHNLPSDEPALDVDTVFRHLVPDEFKDGLRRVGGIGGISVDHHPVTGVPAFFLHPCLVGEAISSFPCSRQNYLIIWLGLVGGCVGLWVPKEMVVQ